MTAARIFLAAIITLAVSACGFKPIYATPSGEASALNQRIAVRSVAAPQTITPLVTDALISRMSLKEDQAPEYDLYVTASERADRLAVQIDNTTTRYNYRLRGQYTLINLKTGDRISGRAQAVTSYNIVSSQYSTLFAERTAQEKAANILAEEIERDLLLRLNNDIPEDDGPAPLEIRIDPRTNTLIAPETIDDSFDPFTDADARNAAANPPPPEANDDDEITVPDPVVDQ